MFCVLRNQNLPSDFSRIYNPLLKWLAPVMLLFTSLSVQAQFRKIYSNGDGDSKVTGFHFLSNQEGYIALGNSGIGYTTDTGRTQILKRIAGNNVDYNGYSVNITFGFFANGVHAFSKDELLVYGDYAGVPAILRSTNGGTNFKVMHHTTLNPNNWNGVTSICFTDNKTGYAAEADRITKTTDGGITWKEVLGSADNYFSTIQAVNANTIFACSDRAETRRLWRSDNAGENWIQINLPVGHLQHAFFLTTTRGWVNLQFPNSNTYATWYTSDGGGSWKQLTDRGFYDFELEKMHFINDSTGFAISTDDQLYKTTDTGKIWEPLPRIKDVPNEQWSERLRSLYCRQNQVWVGGEENGAIGLSLNGGGATIPVARFMADTNGFMQTGLTKLISYSRTNYVHRWLVNGNLVSTNYTATYEHDHTKEADLVQLVVSNGTNTDTAEELLQYPRQYIPEIESFYPTIAEKGTIVEIMGTGFNNVLAVSFGGVPANSFKIVSSEKILAEVAGGATGDLTFKTYFRTINKSGFQFRSNTALPPVISAMSTTHGNIGSTVIFSGQNFHPDPAQNQISFGTIKAGITAASATQLSCTVPAGAIYGSITVLNKATGLSTTAPRQFSVTFPDSTGFSYESFRHSITFTDELGLSGNNTIAADVDGDGKTDLLQEAGTNRYMRIRRNTGTGEKIEFNSETFIPMGNSATVGPLATDLDNDGKPDILHCFYGANPSFARNISTPGKILFEPTRTIMETDELLGMIAEDMDGDGRADVIVRTKKDQLLMFRNTSFPGMISFTTPSLKAMTGSYYNLAAADLDRDGKTDLIVLPPDLRSVALKIKILKNQSTIGNISFNENSEIQLPVGTNTGGIFKLADYDGDGKTDIISFFDYKILIYLNTSSGGNISFATPVIFDQLDVYDEAMMLANFTGHVYPDLTGGNAHTNIFAFQNESSPGIVKQHPLDLNYNDFPGSFHHRVADFNNDGRPDFVYNTSSYVTKITENRIGYPFVIRICSDRKDSIVSLIPGTDFQWQVNKGAGWINLADDEYFSATASSKVIMQKLPVAWNNYKLRCLTDGRPGTIYQLRVAPRLLPGVSVAGGSEVFCEGEMTAIKAQFSDAGENPLFKWYVNGEEKQYSADSVFRYNKLLDGDKVHFTIISSEKCGDNIENSIVPITMKKKGDFTAVSIQPLADVICIDSMVTYKAVATNGGLHPTFEWKYDGNQVVKDQSEIKVAFNSINRLISVTMTSDAATCNNGPVSTGLTVNPQRSFTSHVTLYPSTTAICEGTPINIYAAPDANHNEVPKLEWYLNDQITDHTGYYWKVQLPPGSKIQVKITSTLRCTSPAFSEPLILTKGEGPILVPKITLTGIKQVPSPQQVEINAGIENPGTIKKIRWEDSVHGAWRQNPYFDGQTSIRYEAWPPVKLRMIITSAINCIGDTTVTSAPHEITVGTVTSTGPEPVGNFGIKYYPNPVLKELVIEGLNPSEKWESLVITDLAGKKQLELTVKNQRKMMVQLPGLTPGLYIAILQRKYGKHAYIKFVKQ